MSKQTKQVRLTFSALFASDVACTLEIVKSENVLHFVVSVQNGPVSICDALFNLGNQELLHVVRLLVAKQSCQVLYTAKMYTRLANEDLNKMEKG